MVTKVAECTLSWKQEADKEKTSLYSRSVIMSIGAEAKLSHLVITSAMRNSEEQALTMYANEQRRIFYTAEAAADRTKLAQVVKDTAAGKLTPAQASKAKHALTGKITADEASARAGTVSYGPAGRQVLKIATDALAKAKPTSGDAPIESSTLEDMLAMIKKVTLPAVTHHASIFALEVFDLRIKDLSNDAKARLKKAILRRLGGQIYRFGYPGGPKNNRQQFDDGAFHIEILQPGDYESTGSTRTLA